MEMRRTRGVVRVKALTFILAPLSFLARSPYLALWNFVRVSARGGGGNFIEARGAIMFIFTGILSIKTAGQIG